MGTNSTTMVRVVVLLLVLLSSQSEGFNEIPDGQNYEVVFPRKLHAYHKRDTQSEYPDLVQYKLEVNKTPMVLHLEKTEGLFKNERSNLIGCYGQLRKFSSGQDGSPVTTSPKMKDHCFYQGYVKNDSSSLVILSTCNGLSGVIITEDKTFRIQRLKRSEAGAHAVYQSQAQETPKPCGVGGRGVDETKTKIDFSSISKEKQEFLKSRKYIELYMVADNSMYKRFNQSENEIRQRIYGMVNFVNQVYKPLNIFVALTGFEIWNTENQFDVVTSVQVTLGRFAEWREKQLLPRKPHDNAQFLTNIDFDGPRLGLGWVGTICSNTHSAGVIQDHISEYIPVAVTLAHILGHNVGMGHDDECCCDTSSCIMSPAISQIPAKTFSSCSQQQYQKFLLDNMPLCMNNKPNTAEVLSPPVCGNRFTERGEECDCGTVEECTDKCCDAATCKLKDGAQCAEGECCLDCKLRAAGSVCRPAKDDCDLSEMCDGKSATCPSDRFRLSGSPCQNGEGYCYNGKCPTFRSQCETYWGAGSVAANNICYGITQRYCLQSRYGQCGALICSGGSSRPIIHTFGQCTYSDCKVVTPEVLVKSGTKCEDGKICINGKCTAVPEAIQSEDCATKCPEHSVCDHELQCQCEEGWAPPNCDTRADNGSED